MTLLFSDQYIGIKYEMPLTLSVRYAVAPGIRSNPTPTHGFQRSFSSHFTMMTLVLGQITVM